MLAFLERRRARWTDGWLRREVERRTPEPAERLLAVFDVFDGWFRDPAFEGCAFINVLLEADAGHPARAASVAELADIRSFLEGLARGRRRRRSGRPGPQLAPADEGRDHRRRRAGRGRRPARAAHRAPPAGRGARVTATLDDLRARLAELADLGALSRLAAWDQRTMMPPEGAPARAQQMATLRAARPRPRRRRADRCLAGRARGRRRGPGEIERDIVRLARRDYERVTPRPGRAGRRAGARRAPRARTSGRPPAPRTTSPPSPRRCGATSSSRASSARCLAGAGAVRRAAGPTTTSG